MIDLTSSQFICVLEQMFLNLLFVRRDGKCLLWFTSFVWAEQHSEVKTVYESSVRYEIVWASALTILMLCAGHMLGVAASWVVQVGIEMYRFFTSIFKSGEDDTDVDKGKQVRLLGQNIFMATFRCGSSLVFASIGAGIGATLFRPSTGQWIGKTCIQDYNKVVH